MAVADQGPLLQTETISIEYPGDVHQSPKPIRTLEKVKLTRLLENRRNMLYLGEDNFTFSVAFAAWRKAREANCDPWKGITSTPWKPQSHHDQELPQFSTVQVQCMDNAFNYNEKATKWFSNEVDHLGLSSDVGISGNQHLLEKIRILSELPEPNDHWKLDLEDPEEKHDALWFQYLPVHPSEPEKVTRTINEFVRLVLHWCTCEGDLVCLGITKHKDYVRHYKLEEILGRDFSGTDNSILLLQDFHFLGADTKLIAEILSYGYCHHNRDIHDALIPHHVTLVFQRKKIPTTTTRKEQAKPKPKH